MAPIGFVLALQQGLMGQPRRLKLVLVMRMTDGKGCWDVEEGLGSVQIEPLSRPLILNDLQGLSQVTRRTAEGPIIQVPGIDLQGLPHDAAMGPVMWFGGHT